MINRVSASEEKEILIGLLKYFDDICRRNNIEYSLSGGTLLGAVRHGGFIPWDDDVDVMMTRKNYERFKSVYTQSVKDRGTYLLTEDEPKYYYCFSKLCDARTILRPEVPLDYGINEMGVYLDIFPMDRLPSNSNTRDLYVKNIRKMQDNMFYIIPKQYYYSDKRLKMFLKFFIYRHRYWRIKSSGITPEMFQKRILNEIKKYYGTSENMGAYILSEYGAKEIVPYKIFESYQDIKFENLILRSICDTDIYLSALYDNYMKLPPLEKRQPKHQYNQYWKS